jgi:16S rRNA (cytidine1402-2'-O)-methyltransferase
MINSISDNDDIKKGLYLVPTPIGNLGDITLRAIETLKKSDYILCEDTRVSKVLLKKFNINTKLLSNHKFNETKNLSRVTSLLQEGKIISLISDAGTPSISDPGAILIRDCIKKEIKVFPLPGPSAVSTAVSTSGFSEKYFFYGFFPDKNKDLKKDIKILTELNCCIVFFISPKKINKNIPFIKENFADREILICREISKFYEEYLRFSVNELNLFSKPPKGELTLVISEKKIDKINSHLLSESDKSNINKMINKLSVKEITNLISQNSKVSKKEIYNYCLKLKNEK